MYKTVMYVYIIFCYTRPVKQKFYVYIIQFIQLKINNMYILTNRIISDIIIVNNGYIHYFSKLIGGI